MSAWWILPSAVLVAGATLLWWMSGRAADEVDQLRTGLGAWHDAHEELEALRTDARRVGARYRQVRRR